jgi:hypothetical protein
MVSDTVSAALIGVIAALSGTLVGLVAEPIRARFAFKARQKQLRRILYGELVIKLQTVLSVCAVTYISAIESAAIDYLKSANKLELVGRIEFPDEAHAQAQFHVVFYSAFV